MCVIALSAPIVAVWAEPSCPKPSLLALEHAVARFETWLGRTILNGRGWEEDGLGERRCERAPLLSLADHRRKAGGPLNPISQTGQQSLSTCRYSDKMPCARR